MNVLAGKIYLVGLGPGERKYMTQAAEDAIIKSDVIIGYKVYIALIEDLLKDKEVISSGMRKEIERCEMAWQYASQGKIVTLVSSGDPGLYGMAGPMLELNNKKNPPVEVEVIPGVTAANMAAAVLGSPLMHDTAIISLSDLLTPWSVIEKRLNLAAEGDFITALYNPKSHGRPHYIEKAREIFLQHRNGDTPVGIVRNAGREGQEKWTATLDTMLDYNIDMFTMVIIGNSKTYQVDDIIITPRGYKL